MKEKIKDLSIIELMEFWTKDWATESPTLEDLSNMRVWEEVFKYRSKRATIKDMIEVRHIADRADMDMPVLWDMGTMLAHAIAGDLYDTVETLTKSVQMLLKEHDKEPAKITMGQLNRLKGGL